MDDVVIKIDHVSKVFKLPNEKQSSVKGALINFRKRKKGYERQRALNDVSFDIKRGEFFGIVGRNGSGKSTLLKLLAGIYSPTTGTAQVMGKLTPFIELGVGFNAELTGRENVFLNGALLGFSRKEMLAMYDDIVEFAEIERFMDQKLKNYSSGMQVRLAFSIAIQAKSDVLLIDEVLAVGDLAFQEKCYKVFDDIKASGRTVVFISHDSSAIERFCDRAAIIDGGKLVAVGEPQSMVLEYGALVADEQYENQNENGKAHQGSGAVNISDVLVLNGQNKSSTSVNFGHPFTIELHYELHRPIEGNVVIGVDILDSDGISVLGPNTGEIKEKIMLKESGKVRVAFPATPLSPDTYTITAGIFNDNSSMAYDLVTNAMTFKIIGKGRHGKIYVEPRWTITEDSK